MRIIVYNYILRPPIEWTEQAEMELRRKNRLWNTFVEIEHYYRDEYEQILRRSELLREIMNQIDALKDESEELFAQRRKRRAAVRSRAQAQTEEIDSRLAEIRQAQKPLFEAYRKHAPAARKEMKDLLDASEIERRAMAKLAYQRSGLYWGNYNDIRARYATARMRAMKEGRRLRFHAYDGSGTFTLQFQGGMPVAELVDLRRWDGQRLIGSALCRPGEPGEQSDYVLLFRISGSHFLEFPLFLSRPLPEHAQIKYAYVTRRRLADKFRYRVSFCLQITEADFPQTPTGSGVAGINLGWRHIPAGLRIATAVFDDGTHVHLNLPDTWLASWEYLERLTSELAQQVEDVLLKMKAALDSIAPNAVEIEGYPSEMLARLRRLQQAPRIGTRRLLDLLWDIIMLWEQQPNTLGVLYPLEQELREARSQIKRKWIESENKRDKLLAFRRDTYWKFAKQIADRASAAAIDATDYSKTIRRETVSGEASDLAPPARRFAHLAAPGELREKIISTMKRRGGHVILSAEKINFCHLCGSRDIKGDLFRRCERCNTIFDVDENAARNLLQSFYAEDGA